MKKSRGWVIFYYTKIPRPPEVIEDMKVLLERVHKLAKTKALHVVCEIGECVGDFS